MTPPTTPSLDSIVHDGPGVRIGAFRCPVRNPRFSDSGPIQNDIFVFPRSSVRIRHSGGPSFVADHTIATVYNWGQIYDRCAVDGQGDRSDWFAVPRAVAHEAVAANGMEPSAHGPFSFPFAPVTDATYLRQRRLFRRAEHGVATSEVHEEVYALLDDVVSSAASRRLKAPRSPDARSTRIGEAIRSVISAGFAEEWPLSRLEALFGASAFSLCRAFRKATGSTIHRYTLTLRLRASLERLEQPSVEITTVALDLGFSSHSHFSLSFGRTFQETPSSFRQALAAPAFQSAVSTLGNSVFGYGTGGS